MALGIGDDAAALAVPDGFRLLATTDMLVAGVHFLHDAPPRALGGRALAINVSDIAAMGGLPLAALVSLALPPSTPVQWVEELYEGLAAGARQLGMGIAGGNVTRTSGPICIDITVLGTAAAGRLVTRDGALVGDILGVTGVLGSEAARRATSGQRSDLDLPVPVPRVDAGRNLAATGAVHAMIDLSDGLAADLHHLAAASRVGAVVRAADVPVSIEARKAAASLGTNPLDFALAGGEDYELLFTVAGTDWDRIVSVSGSLSLYRIGTILAAEHGVVLEKDGGRREPLPATGWRHF